MATVSVRYIVDDVDTAINFYREHLAFTLVMHPVPPFAMLERGDLRLLLSAPSGQGGGGQSMPDGTRPDVTFLLPDERVQHMDVKFPLAAYLRWCEATTEPDMETVRLGMEVANQVLGFAEGLRREP